MVLQLSSRVGVGFLLNSFSKFFGELFYTYFFEDPPRRIPSSLFPAPISSVDAEHDRSVIAEVFRLAHSLIRDGGSYAVYGDIQDRRLVTCGKSCHSYIV